MRTLAMLAAVAAAGFAGYWAALPPDANAASFYRFHLGQSPDDVLRLVEEIQRVPRPLLRGRGNEQYIATQSIHRWESIPVVQTEFYFWNRRLCRIDVLLGELMDDEGLTHDDYAAAAEAALLRRGGRHGEAKIDRTPFRTGRARLCVSFVDEESDSLRLAGSQLGRPFKALGYRGELPPVESYSLPGGHTASEGQGLP